MVRTPYDCPVRSLTSSALPRNLAAFKVSTLMREWHLHRGMGWVQRTPEAVLSYVLATRCNLCSMTNRMTVVQARMSEADARQLDADASVLGLANRSEALREGLRLLHRRARHAALARDYDDFYGTGSEPPVSDVTAIGDQIGAETIAARRRTE